MPIQVPTPEEEAIRDFIRAREDLRPTCVVTERWTEELLRDGLIQQSDRPGEGDSTQCIPFTVFREAAKTGVVRPDPIGLLTEVSEGLRKEVSDLVREWLLRKLASPS